MTRDRLVPLLASAAAAGALPPALLHFLGGTRVELGSAVHFAVVAPAALVAVGASAALTVVAVRRDDARAALVGTAFSVMAALLVVHGVATPGLFVGMNGVVAFSGAATLPVGAALLALTALPALRGLRAVRRLLWLQGVLLAGVLALGTVGMLVPSAVPSVPETDSAPALALLVVGGLFYALLAVRALRTYQLARRTGDLVVLVGIVWLGAALVAALTLDFMELGWWLGHGFEVIGIALVATPVALDLRGPAPSRPLHGDLRGVELVTEEERYLGADVRALTRLLAEKDAYTEEHTRRVALLAVAVGEDLGLSPARLRRLAIGALLHDVGKLAVADAILQKPGALDAAELSAIRRHPRSGERLVGDLGFGSEVRRLVRDHHERLDGSGYPEGLAAAELQLDTRILGACDVYDALISTRVYREAWEPERALGLLREGAGTLFDERCVAALERVLRGTGAVREPVAV